MNLRAAGGRTMGAGDTPSGLARQPGLTPVLSDDGTVKPRDRRAPAALVPHLRPFPKAMLNQQQKKTKGRDNDCISGVYEQAA